MKSKQSHLHLKLQSDCPNKTYMHSLVQEFFGIKPVFDQGSSVNLILFSFAYSIVNVEQNTSIS